MVYRYSWIAGAAGIGLALYRLQGLVQSTAEGAPWQLVVVAGAVLGAVITWTALAYRINPVIVVVVNLAALVFTSVRIAVPDTTTWLLPTAESFSALRTEMSYAFDVIRGGVAPVIPASGLVVVITAVFWGLGMLLVWGLSTSRPFLALTPPAVIYLQLATADRGPFAGPAWGLALVALIAGSLAAVTLDERATTGRLTRTRSAAAGGVLSATSLVTLVGALVFALFTSTAFAGAVPATGVLEWRQASGLTGSYFGGVSYNPFVSIQKSLVSDRNVPVFAARVDGDVDPGRIYWRLLSLDTFNGTWWYAADPEVVRLEESSFERDSASFSGTTAELVQDVQILQLRNEWLPAAYSPVDVAVDSREVARGIRIAPDASIRFGSGSFRGMRYQVTSEVPMPDLGVLSVAEDGTASATFDEVAAEGLLEVPADLPDDRPMPPDSERYLELPEDLEPGIAIAAADVTFGLETDYERGLALEAFLRSPRNGFRYSTEIPPAAVEGDLAAWLLDDEDPNYRLGYCEQFATAMGVMARAVGIPSRVVIGFTPGRTQDDGTIVVLDTNAHAWVELWMGRQGWVRFDPTPRSDGVNPATIDEVVSDLGVDIRPLLEIERPDPIDIETAALPPPQLAADDFPQRVIGSAGGTDESSRGRFFPGWAVTVLVLAIGAAIVASGLPLLKWWRRRRRLARLRNGDISAAWLELTGKLSDLGEPPAPSQTPLEYARQTDEAMQPLATVYSASIYGPERATTETLLDVAEDALLTTEANVATRFSPAQRLFSQYRLRSLRVRPSRRERRRSANGWARNGWRRDG